MAEKTPEQIEQSAAPAYLDEPASSTAPTGTEASEEVLAKLQATKLDDLTTATDRQGAPLSALPPPAPVTTTLGAIDDEPVDPRLASLLAIFPNFDPTVLGSVLDACDGDQERAVEMLLGMSDPNYVPQETGHSQSQTDLDEQLAQRLMLEEEENAARSGQQGQIQVPYQPRQRAPRRNVALPPQGGGYPIDTGLPGVGTGGMGQGTWSGVDTAQISEQFGKFAETGKKTFSSLFSKMKQKMQDFDKPSTDASDPSNQPVNASEWNQSPRGGYMDADDFTLPTPAPQGQKPQGYTVGAGPFQPPPTAPPKTTPSLPRGGPTIRESSSDSHPAIGASGSSSPPPAQIDVSKINLLPKRPVSLAVGTEGKAPAKDDDDDLEYVENPFEDR